MSISKSPLPFSGPHAPAISSRRSSRLKGSRIRCRLRVQHRDELVPHGEGAKYISLRIVVAYVVAKNIIFDSGFELPIIRSMCFQQIDVGQPARLQEVHKTLVEPFLPLKSLHDFPWVVRKNVKNFLVI